MSTMPTALSTSRRLSLASQGHIVVDPLLAAHWAKTLTPHKIFARLVEALDGYEQNGSPLVATTIHTLLAAGVIMGITEGPEELMARLEACLPPLTMVI